MLKALGLDQTWYRISEKFPTKYSRYQPDSESCILHSPKQIAQKHPRQDNIRPIRDLRNNIRTVGSPSLIYRTLTTSEYEAPQRFSFLTNRYLQYMWGMVARAVSHALFIARQKNRTSTNEEETLFGRVLCWCRSCVGASPRHDLCFVATKYITTIITISITMMIKKVRSLF